MRNISKTGLLLATLAASSPTSATDPVDYPDGYRLWAHVKSMAIHKGHSLEVPFLGIHHVYANRQALRGLDSKRYEDGAIFVFDQYEFQTKDKASTEGPRVLLGVMVKDRARFPATGGWGYEAWSGNSRGERLVADGGVSCHACHAQRKSQDFVFSQWRD